MMSLFRPFDTYYSSLILGFATLILSGYLYLSCSYFLGIKNMFNGINSIILYLLVNSEFVSKYYFNIFFSFFFIIFLLNFSSLMPFFYSWTSQIRVVLLLAGSFWISLVSFYIIRNFNIFLRHLVPSGTPIILVFFIVLIEVIRQIIRPLTLTVRLVSNILAGHLLIHLIFDFSSGFFSCSLFVALFTLVELAVSLIQSYIFVTLSTLFYSELS